MTTYVYNKSKEKAYKCIVRFSGRDVNLVMYIKSPTGKTVKVPVKNWLSRLGGYSQAFCLKLMDAGALGADWKKGTPIVLSKTEMVWALAEGKLVKPAAPSKPSKGKKGKGR